MGTNTFSSKKDTGKNVARLPQQNQEDGVEEAFDAANINQTVVNNPGGPKTLT